MGRVVRQIDEKLLVETEAPQALPGGATPAVWFVPRSARELRTGQTTVVRGTLSADATGGASDGEHLTAQVVVVDRWNTR